LEKKSLTWLQYAENIQFFKNLSPKEKIKENAENLFAVATGTKTNELKYEGVASIIATGITCREKNFPTGLNPLQY